MNAQDEMLRIKQIALDWSAPYFNLFGGNAFSRVFSLIALLAAIALAALLLFEVGSLLRRILRHGPIMTLDAEDHGKSEIVERSAPGLPILVEGAVTPTKKSVEEKASGAPAAEDVEMIAPAANVVTHVPEETLSIHHPAPQFKNGMEGITAGAPIEAISAEFQKICESLESAIRRAAEEGRASAGRLLKLHEETCAALSRIESTMSGIATQIEGSRARNVANGRQLESLAAAVTALREDRENIGEARNGHSVVNPSPPKFSMEIAEIIRDLQDG